MKSKKKVVEIDHNLNIDDQVDGISIDKLIKDLQAIRKEARKQGIRRPKIIFDAGYNSMTVTVSGTKYVKPTVAQIKAEKIRVAKLKLRAQMTKEQKQLRREQEERFEKWLTEHTSQPG